MKSFCGRSSFFCSVSEFPGAVYLILAYDTYVLNRTVPSFRPGGAVCLKHCYQIK